MHQTNSFLMSAAYWISNMYDDYIENPMAFEPRHAEFAGIDNAGSNWCAGSKEYCVLGPWNLGYVQSNGRTIPVSAQIFSAGGTSISTPYTAGVAWLVSYALMHHYTWEDGINLAQARMMAAAIIKSCAIDLGEPGIDNVTGLGLLHVGCLEDGDGLIDDPMSVIKPQFLFLDRYGNDFYPVVKKEKTLIAVHDNPLERVLSVVTTTTATTNSHGTQTTTETTITELEITRTITTITTVIAIDDTETISTETTTYTYPETRKQTFITEFSEHSTERVASISTDTLSSLDHQGIQTTTETTTIVIEIITTATTQTTLIAADGSTTVSVEKSPRIAHRTEQTITVVDNHTTEQILSVSTTILSTADSHGIQTTTETTITFVEVTIALTTQTTVIAADGTMTTTTQSNTYTFQQPRVHTTAIAVADRTTERVLSVATTTTATTNSHGIQTTTETTITLVEVTQTITTQTTVISADGYRTVFTEESTAVSQETRTDVSVAKVEKPCHVINRCILIRAKVFLEGALH